MDGKLNAALLRQLEEDASALLGEHYPKLVAQRTRGFDSKLPPTNPHRLVDEIRRVAASRHNLEAGKGLVDAETIIEVRTLLAFAERWEERRALAGAPEFAPRPESVRPHVAPPTGAPRVVG